MCVSPFHLNTSNLQMYAIIKTHIQKFSTETSS